MLDGRSVEDLFGVQGGTVITTAGGIGLLFSGTRMDFGDKADWSYGELINPLCRKNIEMEPCTLDFIKSLVVGRKISSAGDFGGYLEFGLDQQFNLGLHHIGFHLISTESPIEAHRL